MDKQQLFNVYMESFVNLRSEQKYREVIEKQLKIINLLVMYCKNMGVEPILFNNRELEDLKKEHPTQDDYIEAIMVYTQNIEELYGQVLGN